MFSTPVARLLRVLRLPDWGAPAFVFVQFNLSRSFMVKTDLFASAHCASHFDADATDREQCLQRLYLPLIESGAPPIIVTANSSAENLSWLRAAYPAALLTEIPRYRLLPELEKRFGPTLASEAVLDLACAAPSLSARTVLTLRQSFVFGALTFIVAVAVLLSPLQTWGVLIGLLSAVFVAGTLFRAFLALISATEPHMESIIASQDASLPVYTILVPMYREANVLPRLVRSLLLLDYPRDRLDIKLIVEADDPETAAAAVAMADRGPFEVIRVPQGTPRTKPRACNYAFKFARGEYTVIYDAEDRPERDQLLKAVSMFRRSSRDVSCLQARLNFYNAHENWLTRGIMAQTPPLAAKWLI